MIAALFVAKGGCYFGLPDVDPWDAERDARKYAGPWPVVAHPPCERWGRFWYGAPCSPRRFERGDDGGCFEAALRAVRTFGGVLEHPCGSSAWRAFQLVEPRHGGYWMAADTEGGFTCYVEQGQYGHAARKPTWLYACGARLPRLRWGCEAPRLDSDDPIERRRLSRAGEVAFLSHKQRKATPHAFRDVLLSIARSVEPQHAAQRAGEGPDRG